MKRKYQSRLRETHKEATRQAILSAAVRLHGQGELSLEALARAAGVSAAAVRKHFPTRENLFRGCTEHFMATVPIPPLEQLAAIPDPGRRVTELVDRILAVHEAGFGQTWLAYRLEDQSPVMAEARAGLAAYLDAAARVLTGDGHSQTGFVRGLLDPLTYRALRLYGGLDPEAAARQTALAIASALAISLPDTDRKGDTNREVHQP